MKIKNFVENITEIGNFVYLILFKIKFGDFEHYNIMEKNFIKYNNSFWNSYPVDFKTVYNYFNFDKSQLNEEASLLFLNLIGVIN